jgi:hypothetical protein
MRHSLTRAAAFAFAFAACALSAGCGSSSDVVPVSGTLTYQGKPVTDAIVHFVPESGRPSLGETDASGQFTLTYDPETKGAKLGKHRVFVMLNPVATSNMKGAIPGKAVKQSADMAKFYDKYGGTNSKVEVVIDKKVSDLKLAWD